MSSRSPVLGLLGVLVFAACDDAAGPRPPAASVDITLAGDTLLTGSSLELSAEATTGSGDPIPSGDITWATSDPSVATVSHQGIVTAVARGEAVIYAAIDALADSVRLLVIDPFRAVELTAGSGFTCAIDEAGTGYCWGSNFSGTLGNGLVHGSFTRPTPIAGGLTWASIQGGEQHGCGITTAGSAFCWGYNGLGQLGDNTTTSRIVPTAVQSSTPFLALATGFFHTCGLSAAGAECWGNLDGFTGLSLETLVAGWDHECGLTSAGAAYCWGSNFNGQLGDGSLSFRAAPVPVAGNLTFDALDAGSRFTCGIAAEAAYCWGNNQTGQLGTGTTNPEVFPTVVVGGHPFVAISGGGSHACALTVQGNAWCWGSNYGGQLGDGTQTDRLIPVPVAGGLVFSRIVAGGGHTCGVAGGGRVYCWGSNWMGQVGDHSLVDRLVPVEVWAP
jgi:alpha-tubulin suppressor-like RCC1 family protein